MNKHIEKYAELLVKAGINIKENQILVISSPIESVEFVRLISTKAYKAGAKDVVIRWNDEVSDKIRYEMAPEETFDEFPNWAVKLLDDYADLDAAFLSIAANDPELLKFIEPKRISRQNKARSKALKNYMNKIMGDSNAWCVASVPTKAWAKKVFPESNEMAMELLWEAIIKAVRADLDQPVKAWREHQESINKKLEMLNSGNFKYIRITNSLGTNVTLELPEGHYWAGGGSCTPKGQHFIPNIPTEEVYTLPRASGVNGVVKSAIPLNYNGNLIKDIELIFEDGIVVKYNASEGLETLREMLETDDGAKRLGELALVPYDSPISNQNILFYNTLFDENASSHLALGKAYPMIKGVENMSEEEKQKVGINDSLIHVDFMIGTKDLFVVGVKHDGIEVQIFKDGNYV